MPDASLSIDGTEVIKKESGTVTLTNVTAGAAVVLGTTSAPIANNLVFADGKGIDFSSASGSASGSSSAVLDDYEEGTWTPTFVGFTPGNGSVSGYYKKIGSQVFVSAKLQYGSTSSMTGNISISNLPFTAATDITFTGTGLANYPGVDTYQIRCTLASGSTTLLLNLNQSASRYVSSSSPSSFTTSSTISLQCAYHV